MNGSITGAEMGALFTIREFGPLLIAMGRISGVEGVIDALRKGNYKLAAFRASVLIASEYVPDKVKDNRVENGVEPKAIENPKESNGNSNTNGGNGELNDAKNTIPRTRPKGVDPNHHNLNVMVRDADGNIVSHDRLVSGNMTAEEKAMGYPKGQNASHTEARFARYKGDSLNEGDSVTMTGQLPPCNSCKGYLNRLAAEKNVDIAYRWRENGVTKTWKVKK